jgi:hypothetical protein
LGACKTFPGFQTELAEKNARITLLEKASLVTAFVPAQFAVRV